MQHTRTGRRVTLPADYVAASTELGYATTIHGAQGVSADTMHGLATGAESRQQLYTMLTRGAAANHLYLQVVGDGDPHGIIRPDNVHPPTATDLLEDILARDDAPVSATTTRASTPPPQPDSATAAARYLDALHLAAEHHLGPAAIAALDKGADRVVPGIAEDPAWPTLRAHLVLLAATGTDPVTALQSRGDHPRAGHRHRPRRGPGLAPGRHRPAQRRRRAAALAARHPPRAAARPAVGPLPDQPLRPRRRR